MTVSSQTKRNSYTATASQTVFAYSFRILNQEHLAVYQNDVLLTLTTHYTVSNVGVSTGGNVTLVTGATVNDSIVILRNVPLLQEVDYIENDPFPAQTHEDALDLIVMSIQELDERMDRSAILVPSSTSTGITIPNPVSGKFIKWKTDLSGFENATGAGSGNVTGPTTSIDNTVPRFSGTDGDTIQGSPLVIADTGASTLTVGMIGTGTPAGMRINATASGGDANTVPNGLYVTGDVTADLFSHMNVILGWSPTQTVKGTYQGVEGRVDLTLAGVGAIGVGVLGRASGDNASSNAGSIAIGVDGQAIKGDSGHSGSGTYYGGRFFATDGDVGRGIYSYAKGNTTSNIHAEFGINTPASGDNGVVSFNGYITDGAGLATAHLQINDNVDQFLINVTDSKLDGLAVWLRDNAGASKFSILDSGATEVASIDSDGNLTLASGADITYKGAELQVKTKTGTFTRAADAATGSVGYTGLGFKPVALWINMVNTTSAVEGSTGFCDSSLSEYATLLNSTIRGHTAGIIVDFNHASASTDLQRASVSSFDSDGFTLAWTKTGTPPAETLTCSYIAIGEW